MLLVIDSRESPLWDGFRIDLLIAAAKSALGLSANTKPDTHTLETALRFELPWLEAGALTEDESEGNAHEHCCCHNRK